MCLTKRVWFRCQDSISKFKAINEQCKAHGVRTAPELVGGQVWVVPLQSWYCDMVEKGGMPSTDLAPLQVNTWPRFEPCSRASICDSDAVFVLRICSAKLQSSDV